MWWIELALVAIGAVGTVATAVVDHTERRANRVLWKVLAVGLTLMASWKLFFSDNSVFFPVRSTTVELPGALPTPATAPVAVAQPVSTSKPIAAAAPAPTSKPVGELARAPAQIQMPQRSGPLEKLWRPRASDLWILKYTMWLWAIGLAGVNFFRIREMEHGRDTGTDVWLGLAGSVAAGAVAWWV